MALVQLNLVQMHFSHYSMLQNKFDLAFILRDWVHVSRVIFFYSVKFSVMAGWISEMFFILLYCCVMGQT